MPAPPDHRDDHARRWTDPYWHRECFFYNGQYWWLGPDGLMYLYVNGWYYRYAYGDSGVVVTPDPTPPVDVPPSAPTPADQTTVYSLDGTRSIQITGDNRDAYLYDLTAADPNSAAAQGRFIGTEVAGVKIDYVTSTAADGTTTQTIQQIELSYEDPSALSVVDLNGERRVDVSGNAQNASLINLADTTVDPVSLAAGVTATTLSYQQGTDDSGNATQSLSSVALSVTDDSGNQSTLTFDRDGNSLDSQSQFRAQSRPLAPQPPAAALQTLQQKFEGSETFRALKSGFGW
jgi:hypothetical protein